MSLLRYEINASEYKPIRRLQFYGHGAADTKVTCGVQASKYLNNLYQFSNGSFVCVDGNEDKINLISMLCWDSSV